jgi:hypothetical protein
MSCLFFLMFFSASEVRQSKNHLRLQRQRVGVEQAYWTDLPFHQTTYYQQCHKWKKKRWTGVTKSYSLSREQKHHQFVLLYQHRCTTTHVLVMCNKRKITRWWSGRSRIPHRHGSWSTGDLLLPLDAIDAIGDMGMLVSLSRTQRRPDASIPTSWSASPSSEIPRPRPVPMSPFHFGRDQWVLSHPQHALFFYMCFTAVRKSKSSLLL